MKTVIKLMLAMAGAAVAVFAMIALMCIAEAEGIAL